MWVYNKYGSRRMENREIALSSVHLDPAEIVDRYEPPTPPRPVQQGARPPHGGRSAARRGCSPCLSCSYLQPDGCPVRKHQHPAARRVSAPAKAGFTLFVSADPPPRGEAMQRAGFAALLIVLAETPGGCDMIYDVYPDGTVVVRR